MQQETFIVGNREFTCVRMNAFTANNLMLRIQKIALPVIGSMIGGGNGLGEINVTDAARIISQSIDEGVMTDIVLPMFAESKLYSVEDKRFVKDAAGINLTFTAENLFDMYELIFEVGRYQFAPFFSALMARFGDLGAGQSKK